MSAEKDIDDIDGFDGDSDTEPEIESESNSDVATSIDTYDYDDGTEETTVKSDLFIYKSDCLACSHLIKNVDGVLTKPFRCTSENGNSRCPASVVEISVGVNVEKIASSIYSAQSKMDLVKYAKRIARLAKYPTSVQRRVMERVEELAIAGKSI